MTEKELLIGLATKIFNKTDTELQSIIFDVNETGDVAGIKPDALDQLYNMDANRVKSWKDKQTEVATKVANEKTASVNGYWENVLKTNFAITEDLKGEDLANKVAEMHKANATGTGKGKNSAEYLELESKHKATDKMLKDMEARLQTEYIPKTEMARLNRLYEADSYANSIRAGMGLIADENPTIEQNKQKYFQMELKQRFDDIQRTEDGKYYAVKNGNRIENANGHAVELSEIVKEVATGFWAIKKQDPKGNGGNNNNNGGGGTGRIAEIDARLQVKDITPAEKYSLLLEKEKMLLEKK